MTHRRWVVFAGAVLLSNVNVRAATHSLGESTPESPIIVVFDDTTGRMSVTVKAGGTVWTQGTAGGGSAWVTGGAWSNPDDTSASGPATLNTYPVTVSLQLATSTGALTVTISGSATQDITNSIVYPYPFFKAGGLGYAVLPFFSGFLVPTTDTSWPEPRTHQRLEWLGGTDAARTEGWMAIADPAGDMLLRKQTSTVNGSPRLGGAFQWNGSNANPGLSPNRLSYSRSAILTFYTAGGYAALAKNFRAFTVEKGWHKSLAAKATSNGDVTKLLGAPVIYLWGDGRSDAMLDAMQAAGMDKALIQISINHTDHYNAFPNQTYADGSGWAAAVKSKGWIPGIYDIYGVYRSTATSPPYNGFVYKWAEGGAGPSSFSTTWAYMRADGTWDILGGANAVIAHAMAFPFARDTRLPAQIQQFGLDAFFFDTTCAMEPEEDYAAAYGHTASRAQDIANRALLLSASSGVSAPSHNKLTGTETAKSWAIPYVHWVEGQFRNGKWGTPGKYGEWNNVAYPEVMTDVMEPATHEPNILSSGYQVPLFDLVYHDTVISTQHWHTTHNKLLYVWDLSDLNALVRGQAPILNLVYNGSVGSVGRPIAGATDANTGTFWDMRWTNPNVATRVMQTYDTVCAWHEVVGALPMFDHKILSSDSANNYIVQSSEFSADDGVSGHGIVVNFGTYDGNHGMTNGSTWSGTIRGRSLSVAVGAYATYSWPNTDTTPPGNVTSLTAIPADREMHLSWSNPIAADLAGIRVLRRTDAHPSSPTDSAADVVLDASSSPLPTGLVDTDLNNGTTYFYSVYSYDGVPNYASGAHASGSPARDEAAEPGEPVSNGCGCQGTSAPWTLVLLVAVCLLRARASARIGHRSISI